MNELVEKLLNYLPEDTWIFKIFIVVLLTMIIGFIQRKTFNRLIKKFEQTDNIWDHVLTSSLSKPLYLLIWILGITLAAKIAQNNTENPLLTIANPIRDIGIILSISWFLTRFISKSKIKLVQQGFKSGKPVDITTADAISKLLRISVIITAGLIILQKLGYSISGLLAFGGIGGLAIGFAAKDLLANFFGGLMIYLDRPFNVGDWIRSPDREIEGTVEKIGWRLTTIRTFDKRPLYVPNSVFTNIAVQNPSRMSHRRIHETIGIRYDDANKMKDIVNSVKSMLQNHDEIDTGQTLIVNFNEFAPSSLDFFIYTMTKTTNWIKYHEVKQDVMLKIIDIIEQHGAECAFPTSTVHLKTEQPPVG